MNWFTRPGVTGGSEESRVAELLDDLLACQSSIGGLTSGSHISSSFQDFLY